MSLRKEIVLHEETVIRRHQQIEKEALILDSPCRLRGKLDKGTEKGGVMTAMVKDPVDLEETSI